MQSGEQVYCASPGMETQVALKAPFEAAEEFAMLCIPTAKYFETTHS
jgi:hypothetical protein